jgi:two-component system, cell cycle sensor histidine kinase and response regulator CckA
MNPKSPSEIQRKSPSRTRELIGVNTGELNKILEEEITNQMSTRIKTILIVDDDDLVLSVTKKILEKYNYDVTTTLFPEKALEIIKNDTDKKIDLVISDIMMPKICGPELISAIRKIRSDISVLFISGHPGDQKLDQNDLFLRKPFALLDLTKIIAKISREKTETEIPNERLKA